MSSQPPESSASASPDTSASDVPGAQDRPRSRVPRWSTRDLVGPTLIFVGAFLLAAALALPTLLVSRLEVIGLSTDRTTVAVSVPADAGGVPPGPNTSPAPTATILDRCSLNAPTARTLDATLVRQQRVVAVAPSDSRVVTLQAGTSVQADRIWLDGHIADADAARPGSEHAPAPGEPACTDPTLSAIRDRVTLDRRTVLPDLGANHAGVRGNSEIQYDSASPPVQAPDRTGHTYILPFGVTATERTYFDPTTRRSVPLIPQGDTEIGGRDAIRFVADIPDTDLDAIGAGVVDGVPPTRITRPASWFGVGGDPARELTATLHQTAHITLAVDTATGIILDEQSHVEQTYRVTEPGSAAGVLNLRATFVYDRATRAALADAAGALGTPVVIWGRVVPIVAGVAGAAALVGGLVLTVGPDRMPWTRRRRSRSSR